MSKHTPGPWKVQGTPRRGWDIFSLAKGCYVAFDEPLREGAISLEGDARLIAAAPDLLEALCYLLHTSTGETHEQRLEAMDQARAAIAKAFGENNE